MNRLAYQAKNMLSLVGMFCGSVGLILGICGANAVAATVGACGLLANTVQLRNRRRRRRMELVGNIGIARALYPARKQ